MPSRRRSCTSHRRRGGGADAELEQRGLAARGEAAFRRGDLATARECFAPLEEVPGPIGGLAGVRLGQIALAEGDVLTAYRHLQARQDAADPELATIARDLCRQHQQEAVRLAAEEARLLAVQRAQQAARAAALAAMPAFG